MKKVLPIVGLLLAACNPLSSVPVDALTAVKNAAGSCIRVESLVMGKAVITTANDTKGALVNGNVSINPETCAITISNSRVAPAATQ